MNKTYACSDLHGRYDLWLQILNYCDETDTIYFLGDAIDRGPEGFEVMRSLLQDPRVKYLKGNHEELLTNASLYLFGEETDAESYLVWLANGGNSTYEKLFIKQPIEVSEDYVSTLKKLPIISIYNNKNNQKVILTHAGCDPDSITNVLWNREHLLTSKWTGEENTFIVHGHTPVQHLVSRHFERIETFDGKSFKLNDSPQVAYYCNRHKIDIDIGAYAVNKAVLLDLDTFEPIYFFEENKNLI